MKIFAFAFVSILSLAALPSQATTLTVTFDDPEPELLDGSLVAIGTSQGFTYETTTVGAGGDDLALSDAGGLLKSRIRQGGTPFTPLFIDLRGFSNIYRTGPGEAPLDMNDFDAWTMEGEAPQAGLLLSGLLSSGTYVSQLFTDPLSTLQTVAFGSEFAGITELILTLVLPGEGTLPPAYFSYPQDEAGLSQDWCFEYCAQFNADNLVVTEAPLAPVPLPAGGLALLSGLGLIGMATRRKAR